MRSIINWQWKRILLIGIPVLVAGVAGAMFWLQRAPAPRLPIRNVVLISLDTCRADHLSCYGFPRPTTPNIDRVALALTTNDPTGPVATRIRERLDHYQRALR